MSVDLPPSEDFQWPDNIQAAVSLSFDDARLSQVDHGLAILDAHDVLATFYVVPFAFTQRIAGWKAAAAAGHELGNHTVTHPCSANFDFARKNPLEDYTLERMAEELDGASREIEQSFGVTPETFAYPCGQTYVGRGRETLSYLPLVAVLFLVVRGFYSDRCYDPVRCDLSQTFASDFDGRTFDSVRVMIERTVEQRGWLILAGHETAVPGAQSVREDTLQTLCGYLVEQQEIIWTGTVAAIGRYVRDTRRKNA
ncbi:MAG: polysaccharide deacetylase family protein [Candidatus Hydrogenedentes bacterium]|nr:polysaccharide deacetylase family protein [Candidatus Hydrogenedentota bacterium]